MWGVWGSHKTKLKRQFGADYRRPWLPGQRLTLVLLSPYSRTVSREELLLFPSREEPTEILCWNIEKKHPVSFSPADGCRAGGELVCLTDEWFPPREEISHPRTRKSKEPSSEVIRTLRHYFFNRNSLTTLTTCPDEWMGAGSCGGTTGAGARGEQEERRGGRGTGSGARHVLQPWSSCWPPWSLPSGLPHVPRKSVFVGLTGSEESPKNSRRDPIPSSFLVDFNGISERAGFGRTFLFLPKRGSY